ncbi:MAG: T9SS type A sorting domain-containing protein, partial [Bacteroidales bacterium]|nr:T9SS type A sorting domain-containing protein [Bacteroidales bacterium]
PEENLRLQVAITESHIYHPWGLQPPLDYLDYVNRGFFPDANGTAIDLVNSSSISHEFTIDASAYEIENCEIVAFVESPDDKYIYQTSKVKLNDLITSVHTVDSDQIAVYPNPSSHVFHISIPQEYDENTDYLMTNIYGEIMQRGKLIQGTNSIDVSGLANGNYFLRISMGDRNYVKKIVLIK